MMTSPAVSWLFFKARAKRRFLAAFNALPLAYAIRRASL
jgi:hypothetical protein